MKHPDPLLTLAIDSADRIYSVAILRGSRLLAEWNSLETDEQVSENQNFDPATPPPTRFPPGISVKLFPALRRLLKSVDCRPGDLDLIAVTIGPGLFTGLRVGVVAAKTLAYVNKTPIAAVDTLEVVARQALDQTAHSTQRIKPVLNAQRQQLFGSTFQVNDQCQLKQLGESAIVDRQQWLDQLAPGDLVTGTGLKPLIETIRNSDSVPGIEIASESTWNSTAAQVGALGIEKFLAGHHDDLWKLEPTYFRPSAAEEKAKLKQNL